MDSGLASLRMGVLFRFDVIRRLIAFTVLTPRMIPLVLHLAVRTTLHPKQNGYYDYQDCYDSDHKVNIVILLILFAYLITKVILAKVG